MVVGPIDGAPGPDRVERPQQARKPASVQPAQGVTPPADRVEISDQARLLSELRNLPDVRTDRVEQLRRLIEQKQFESDERIEGAADGFLSDNTDTIA